MSVILIVYGNIPNGIIELILVTNANEQSKMINWTIDFDCLSNNQKYRVDLL